MSSHWSSDPSVKTSAAKFQPHTLRQKSSCPCERKTRWLGNVPLVWHGETYQRTNKTQSQPEVGGSGGSSFLTLLRARGRRFSTCFHTLVRKRRCALTEWWGDVVCQDRATGCDHRGWLHKSQVCVCVFVCVKGGHLSMFGKVKDSRRFSLRLIARGVGMMQSCWLGTPVGSFGKSVD